MHTLAQTVPRHYDSDLLDARLDCRRSPGVANPPLILVADQLELSGVVAAQE